MALVHNWKSFREVLFPNERKTAKTPQLAAPVYFVIDQGIIVDGFAQGEDLMEWIGVPSKEVENQLGHRDYVFIERSQLDDAFDRTSDSTNAYQQLISLRENTKPKVLSQIADRIRISKKSQKEWFQNRAHENFLLSALSGWWRKVSPSAFGIFLRLQAQSTDDYILIFRRGKLDEFFKPDLSSLGDRTRDMNQVVKHLSEKHVLPVQGIQAPRNEWAQWCQASDPWKSVVKSFRSKRTRIYPFRTGVAMMILNRGVLGI